MSNFTPIISELNEFIGNFGLEVAFPISNGHSNSSFRKCCVGLKSEPHTWCKLSLWLSLIDTVDGFLGNIGFVSSSCG